MAGIYVHIPFCGQFCTYCNFYSVIGRGYREKYIQALHAEIEYRKSFFKGSGVSPQTIYFGGGTPSLFPAVRLGEVLEHIKEAFGIACPQEVSIEVNPDDITPQYARQLYEAGFNRVSMGIQSFVDEHLRWMNRRHTSAQGEQAYHNLRNAGFCNISLDLISGFQGLTPQLWEYNLRKMVELSPEHISAYQLSIEPGSSLGRMYEKGEYSLVPDDICLREYKFLQDYLASNGYVQYEVSNFARMDGGRLFKSIHNSSYWTKEPYIGLGPAAHSFIGNIRSWNSASVAKYCRYYGSGEFPSMQAEGGPDAAARPFAAVGGFEELSGRDIFNESVMLGLRTVAGVDLCRLDPLLLNRVRGEIERHCRLGNLVQEGDKIRIPSCRLFVSDGIICDLFV